MPFFAVIGHSFVVVCQHSGASDEAIAVERKAKLDSHHALIAPPSRPIMQLGKSRRGRTC
jgi:hypothetical protein